MRTRHAPHALALAVLGSMLAIPAPRAQSLPGPSIDDVINLKRVGSPVISPNGQQVAYTIRETN